MLSSSRRPVLLLLHQQPSLQTTPPAWNPASSSTHIPATCSSSPGQPLIYGANDFRAKDAPQFLIWPQIPRINGQDWPRGDNSVPTAGLRKRLRGVDGRLCSLDSLICLHGVQIVGYISVAGLVGRWSFLLASLLFALFPTCFRPLCRWFCFFLAAVFAAFAFTVPINLVGTVVPVRRPVFFFLLVIGCSLIFL